jgi:hypothetical protein
VGAGVAGGGGHAVTTLGGPTDTWDVTCVNCLHEFTWDGAQTYRSASAKGPWTPVDLPPRSDPMWGLTAQETFIRCPNVEGGDPHHFPVDFALYEPPVIIGFVGHSNSGKTCLLLALNRAIDEDGLRPYGLAVVPANMTQHDAYVEDLVVPFFRDGVAPAHTEYVPLVEYADAVLLTTPSGRTFPLVFFDAAGETLRAIQGNHKAVRYLHRVAGLIFVADPYLVADGARLEDPTYTATFRSLFWAQQSGGRPMTSIPAAIAITKSDVVRFEPPVDRWLNRPAPPGGYVDPGSFEPESRDAYAFLHARNAVKWLAPVTQFDQCTLHFVSASGASYDEAAGKFVRPARPRRVLEPLLALLSALGVLDAGYAHGAGG